MQRNDLKTRASFALAYDDPLEAPIASDTWSFTNAVDPDVRIRQTIVGDHSTIGCDAEGIEKTNEESPHKQTIRHAR